VASNLLTFPVSLASHLIPQIVAGYGLTETSPTLLNRVVERNVLGSVGVPPEGTEIKIVDPATREEVPVGQGGILVRQRTQNGNRKGAAIIKYLL
jgi:long-subunit acyl-CoA synthetase (AMP-forming)